MFEFFIFEPELL